MNEFDPTGVFPLSDPYALPTMEMIPEEIVHLKIAVDELRARLQDVEAHLARIREGRSA